MHALVGMSPLISRRKMVPTSPGTTCTPPTQPIKVGASIRRVFILISCSTVKDIGDGSNKRGKDVDRCDVYSLLAFCLSRSPLTATHPISRVEVYAVECTSCHFRVLEVTLLHDDVTTHDSLANRFAIVGDIYELFTGCICRMDLGLQIIPAQRFQILSRQLSQELHPPLICSLN